MGPLAGAWERLGRLPGERAAVLQHTSTPFLFIGGERTLVPLDAA